MAVQVNTAISLQKCSIEGGVCARACVCMHGCVCAASASNNELRQRIKVNWVCFVWRQSNNG